MNIEFYPQNRATRIVVSESGRLKAVNKYNNLDFDLNKGLQGIVKLAAEMFSTPIAMITLVGKTDLYMKVRKGVDVCTMPRGLSFCSKALEQEDILVVENTLLDARFNNNPIVTDGPQIRFYAGAQLTTSCGETLGTLCVLDTNPHKFSKAKQHLLEELASQAMYLMELQLSMETTQKQMACIEKQNQALARIAFVQSHEFRSPVASILGLMNIIKDDYSNANEYLELMEEAVKNLDEKIHLVVASTNLAQEAIMA